MAIRRIKVRRHKVWQARIAYRGVQKSALRDTREAAKDAEAELLRQIKAEQQPTALTGTMTE